MRVLLATLLALWTIGLADGVAPSCRLSRFADRRGRLDLVDAGVWNVHYDRDERQGGAKRSLHGTLLSYVGLARPSLSFAANDGIRSSWVPARPPSSPGCRSCPTAMSATPCIIRSTRPCNGCTSTLASRLCSVAATCLIGIVIPTLWGLYLWRTALANFDRLIGRPCKTRQVTE